MDSEDVIELANLFIGRRYARRATLIAAGEKWDKVYYIHEGVVRLFYSDDQGREFNKGFFCEEHVMWPVAPYAREEASLFSIATLKNVTVSACLFSVFYSWLSRHGYWERFALPYAETLAADKCLREYEFLLNSAAERYRNFCKEHPGLAGRIPDYHLASYLGITNVTLSRIRNSADFSLC
jgi:CRP-like cAMP-binding protein